MERIIFVINTIHPAIKKTYGIRGQKIVTMNWTAVDKTDKALQEIPIPSELPKIHGVMNN